jgi:hypothetical protein
MLYFGMLLITLLTVVATALDYGYLVGNISPEEREMPRSIADWVLTMASAKDQTSKVMPLVGNMGCEARRLAGSLLSGLKADMRQKGRQ